MVSCFVTVTELRQYFIVNNQLTILMFISIHFSGHCQVSYNNSSQHMRFWYLHVYHMRKAYFKAHVGVSSMARDLNFILKLHLHIYFVYVSSNVSGDTLHLLLA